MEIYKDLSNPASKEFEKLLNSTLSKNSIEEGKIIEGKINKITDKFVFLFVEGLKSEPVLDINELKSMGLNDKIKLGETIPVLLEKIEDKNGEVLVSASKARKISGWEKLIECYEKNEPIMGKIVSKCKGGAIVEHIDTGSLMFLPGSQISDKPLKDISHLINEPQKFALIKVDKIRGNACVSRREIISNVKKEDRAKIIAKYPIGTIIEKAEVKALSSFGAFFNINGEIDCLCHLQEISYSRINHPDEILSVGESHRLKVISVDNQKLQLGVSIKQLMDDPFNNIDKYEIDKDYDIKIVKLMDFGAFGELEKGLICLLHNSELGYKKSLSAKKMFKIGDVVKCRLV
ncbi:MAG: S1 RNA-binding domain-containing protein, partial [Pseudomonadota bacterium]|nr:S1 RNA-binding domain-containing protein [Pseudomonadota bacterium]